MRDECAKMETLMHTYTHIVRTLSFSFLPLSLSLSPPFFLTLYFSFVHGETWVFFLVVQCFQVLRFVRTNKCRAQSSVLFVRFFVLSDVVGSDCRAQVRRHSFTRFFFFVVRALHGCEIENSFGRAFRRASSVRVSAKRNARLVIFRSTITGGFLLSE